MLDIADRKHLDAVVEFAARHGALDSLGAALGRLATYGVRRPSRCVLTPAQPHTGFDVVMFTNVRGKWMPAFTGTLTYRVTGTPSFDLVRTAVSPDTTVSAAA